MLLAHLSQYVCYYGPNRLDTLGGYELVILQADHYGVDQITWLQRRGTCCVAYLSVGEMPADRLVPEWCLLDPDSGQPAADDRWQTAYADYRLAGWQDHLLYQAVPSILRKGFDGLFLDALDIPEIYPETRPGLIHLLMRLRSELPQRVLIANRGFSVLNETIHLIDAVVFEAFTSYFKDGQYATWEGDDLLWTERQAARLKPLCAGRPILTLDYAAPDDTALQQSVRRRAVNHGFISFTGPIGLDWLPSQSG